MFSGAICAEIAFKLTVQTSDNSICCQILSLNQSTAKRIQTHSSSRSILNDTMADVADQQKTVRLTTTPAIKNAPLPAEGNGSFNNFHLAGLVVVIPLIVSWYIHFGFYTYIFLTLILGLPITIAYWTVMSTFGPRKNEYVRFPGKPIEEYITIKDAELRSKYHGKNKIPMELFHEAFFDDKIDFKGDALDVLEYRHDWATFNFTPSLFKYVLLQMLPEVIIHSKSQDEEQVRDHYDRGDDFYEWFLGPRMIYTSGIINDLTRRETLEELQDNKLALVCQKMDLKKGERMLDIGCGWGTLSAYAAKNFGVDVTGITLGKNQTKFGNARIEKNGVKDNARILCMDYREIPARPKYNKITCLEMAEHVGIRHFQSFLRQVSDMLEDDGLFFLQIAGIRASWQYEGESLTIVLSLTYN